MPRLLPLIALTVLMAIPAAAQNQCTLTMTMNCTGGNCTAVTTNSGSTMCSGEYVVAILIDDDQNRGTVTNFQQTLGLTECFDSSTLPIGFGFGACIGNASLGLGNSFTMSAQVNLNGAPVSEIVAFTGVNDPLTGNDLGFAYVFNNAGPAPTCTPQASVPSVTQSDVAYNVTWSAVSEPNATFTVEESTSPDFMPILYSQNAVLTDQFHHAVTTATTYYYRVRANSCGGAAGPNSPTVSIV